jgi:hypothetical protein
MNGIASLTSLSRSRSLYRKREDSPPAVEKGCGWGGFGGLAWASRLRLQTATSLSLKQENAIDLFIHGGPASFSAARTKRHRGRRIFLLRLLRPSAEAQAA